MNHEPHAGSAALPPFSALDWSADPKITPNSRQIQGAAQCLAEVASSAREAALHEVSAGAELLAALVNVLSCDDPDSRLKLQDSRLKGQDESGDHGQNQCLLADLRDALRDVQHLLDDQPEAQPQFLRRIEMLRERWGEYLELVDAAHADDLIADRWHENVDAGNLSDALDVDWAKPANDEQLRLLLSAVASESEPRQPEMVVQTTIVPTTIISPSFAAAAAKSVAMAPLDGELLDAYLDDAQRCLASMEQTVLALSPGPQRAQQLRTLCRELHTLKGASASVGFEQLARRLHALEDVVESHTSAATVPDRRLLLGEIDAFRQQIHLLTGRVCVNDPSLAPVSIGRTTEPSSESQATNDVTVNEETLRVRASQVDRLMDMLAELVMLRNRRDSRVDQLKEVHGRLLQFVSRLRAWPATALESHDFSRQDVAESLGHEANELLEVARILRDLFEPMAEEQRGISRFIGQFRQELTELRRLPIAGLFQRLQRAVHDAAQVDGKHVRLRFMGEQTGLERSLQERLYEPLLHIVRNAVSHGIESEVDRLAVGKDPVGTITLQADGGTNLLAVSVLDDGRGLNYDALRRRGAELGLIDADRPATRDELSQLIFRPGFSTQASTTQVAGRGVGMDVVAATLERLHGWVELQSTTGQGTQIRLVIPRRSVIEHAMVFRVENQLLALPMQFVHEITPSEYKSGETDRSDCERLPIHFSELFSSSAAPSTTGNRILVLASSGERLGSRSAGRRMALAVDEVLGPQEVVVRPLPQLLSGHPLLSGISLSATGDIVLLLHSQRLVELAIARDRARRVSAERV